MPEFLRAYAVVSLCGWAVYPLVRRLMASLPDCGYSACRCIGWVLAAWVAWILTWTTGRPLDPGAALGSVGLVAVACWLPSVAGRRLHGAAAGPTRRDHRFPPLVLVLCTEGLFLAGMLFFVFLQERNPAVDPDSERFMDYAFLRACLRTPGLPLVDPWFAGAHAAYYHFGYALVAFLVRACGADPARCLVTAVALPYALVWTGAFGIGSALTSRIRGGLWAAFFVLGAGNLQWLKQGARIFRPASFDWFAPARVIEGAITEFPWFSLLWGDLHPYALALPIALAVLALVLACTWIPGEDAGSRGNPEGGRFRAARVALLALMGGALLATHPWDYPLIFGAGIVIAACAGGRQRWAGVVSVLIAATFAWPLFLPFLQGLAIRGHGLARVASRSSPEGWCMAYGPFALMGLGVPLLVRGLRRPAVLPGEARSAGRVGLALAACALLVALACEVVYVRDLFDTGPLARMNTVFKLHRVAWLLLSLASPMWMERALSPAPGPWSRLHVGAARGWAGLVLFAALVYPVCGTLAWMSGRASELRRQEGEVRAALLPGADAEALFRARMPGDAAAAAFLAASAGTTGAVLEETGEPYTWSSRISTFSGVPSVLGWGNHEAVWRNDWSGIQSREADIADFYAHPGSPEACARLRGYGVAWIVAGDLERRRYGTSVDALRTLASPRFASAGTEVYSASDVCARAGR